MTLEQAASDGITSILLFQTDGALLARAHAPKSSSTVAFPYNHSSLSTSFSASSSASSLSSSSSSAAQNQDEVVASMLSSIWSSQTALSKQTYKRAAQQQQRLGGGGGTMMTAVPEGGISHMQFDLDGGRLILLPIGVFLLSIIADNTMEIGNLMNRVAVVAQTLQPLTALFPGEGVTKVPLL